MPSYIFFEKENVETSISQTANPKGKIEKLNASIWGPMVGLAPIYVWLS